MKYLSHHKNLLAGLIFFTLLVVSGIALVATDNWENPFSAFTSSSMEGGRGPQRNGQGMPSSGNADSAAATDSTATTENTSDTSSAMTPPGQGEGMGNGMGEGSGGSHNSDGITWSQFGRVLYNVWYLFAAAGVVMLIGQAIRFTRKTLSHRNGTAVSIS